MQAIPDDSIGRIESHLKTIYGSQTDEVIPSVLQLMQRYADQLSATPRDLWSERDIALITYGDQITESGRPSLDTLGQFLSRYDLDKLFSIVHILPFCPYSSDDGFSVIDFRKVDERLGDWSHLRRLAEQVDLMYDLVLNHVSQHSEWFEGYLQGNSRFADWFHDVDPTVDLSQVTRPRNHPLLTEFESHQGPRHIWTTFSSDQIDLNYGEPAVLLEILDILLFYVANGARVIRLDAIAFLWKELGTTCLHLEQTHAVVKLFRCIFDAIAPGVLLLTETNVPHSENISYFGQGDEAHMVYNFSLPPLLYDAYVQREASPLQAWLRELKAPRQGTTWFNFTASHDGIGVRPLEGLVDGSRFEQLIRATRQRGGEVSTRQMPSGQTRPYELNITWRDAMSTPGDDSKLLVRRMLSSQAFMLALQGVPATYFHSLVGTPNDLFGMRKSQQNRRINRRKYDDGELSRLLEHDPLQTLVFDGYRKLLALRKKQPAFHPNGAQESVDVENASVVAFRRSSPDGQQNIFVVANFSDAPQDVRCDSLVESHAQRDLIDDRTLDPQRLTLKPCQICWLESQ